MEKTAGIRKENKENAHGEHEDNTRHATFSTLLQYTHNRKYNTQNGMPLKEDRIGHRLLSNTV